MVAVYSFQRWDIAAGRYVIPHLKGTADFIDRSGGEIIFNTKEDIQSSALDGQGRYVQKKTGANAASRS